MQLYLGWQVQSISVVLAATHAWAETLLHCGFGAASKTAKRCRVIFGTTSPWVGNGFGPE
jgi:hypothetical protein